MYYKKHLFGLLACLLFVTCAAYGSYIANDASYMATSLITPKENLATKYASPDKSTETPKPELYTKYVKKVFNREKLFYLYNKYDKQIICPISIEEANTILANDFNGNTEEWNEFLTDCGIKYMIKQHLAEENLTGIKKNKAEEVQIFFTSITSDYITLLLQKNSLSLLLSSVKLDNKLIIENRLKWYFNDLITSWNQVSANTTDSSEAEGIITNHKIKEIGQCVFKFMQCYGYYDFFTYILSDNFTNEYIIDTKLFENIIMFAEVHIYKLNNKREIFADLLSLFKNKIKEYAPDDIKIKAMEVFMITCQKESSILILNLEKQAGEYKQKAERAEAELAKVRIQTKQKIDTTEVEKTELTYKIAIYEAQKKESLLKQKESQSEISALEKQLEKQKAANEFEKKQLQVSIKNQEERNALLEKEKEKFKKEVDGSKETIRNKDDSYKKLNEIIKDTEKQLEQKTKELDVAAKQAELLKEQNKVIKKQRLEQVSKQLQSYKPQEKQKVNEYQGTSFFNENKAVLKDGIIANLKEIQQELRAANVQPSKYEKGEWSQFAYFIDALIEQTNLKK